MDLEPAHYHEMGIHFVRDTSPLHGDMYTFTDTWGNLFEPVHLLACFGNMGGVQITRKNKTTQTQEEHVKLHTDSNLNSGFNLLP